MHLTPAKFCLAAIVLAYSSTAGAADTSSPGKIEAIIAQLEAVQTFSDVSISPDGKWITWTQSGASGGDSRVFLCQSQGSGNPKQLDFGNGMDPSRIASVAWTPDSNRAIFLFDQAGTATLYSWSVNDGKAHRLAELHGYASSVRPSPDGRRIAFLFAENGGGGGPLEAVPAQTGAIGSDIHNARIAVLDQNGNGLRQVSSASLNMYEYDWSPDASRFVALAAPGPADNNWWIAKLYTVAVDSGKADLLYSPPAEQQIAVPRWSPDGKRIAFIGGLMSDEGFNGGDIFTIDSAGGNAEDRTPGRKSSVSGLEWRNDSRLVFTEYVKGGSAVSELNLDGNPVESLWQGQENVHLDGNYLNFALAHDGRTSAVVRSSWERAPEVWSGPVGEWHALTGANKTQQPHWGRSESVTWQNDGFDVQGWLLYPLHYDASKKYPMIVEIHGGPANGKTPSWPTPRFDMSVMAGLGYFVFFPNPRGSYGQGEAFTRANVKDFGGGDLRDILAGVDSVVKRGSVDGNRLGVTGWSYGGFMTMWTVTQTQRFRAAVAGAGIADWLSYYGENSIDEWMIPYFGASVYDDPQVYAKSSPITYIKQVTTPTLVVVGERDGECPAPQSFEFWHALQTLKIPTQLVVYPGEGHSFRQPEHRVDVLRRAVSWFDEYLGK